MLLCSVADLSSTKKPSFYRIFCAVAYLFVVALTVLLSQQCCALQIHTYPVHVNCNVFAARVFERTQPVLAMDLRARCTYLDDRTFADGWGRRRPKQAERKKWAIQYTTHSTHMNRYTLQHFSILQHTTHNSQDYRKSIRNDTFQPEQVKWTVTFFSNKMQYKMIEVLSVVWPHCLAVVFC